MQSRRPGQRLSRLDVARYVVVALFAAMGVRLFQVQVLQHRSYVALADGQHSVFSQLFPERGRLLVKDLDEPDQLYPLADNRDEGLLYAEPPRLSDASSTAAALAPILGLDADATATLGQRLADRARRYVAIEHRLTEAQVAAVHQLNLTGVAVTSERWRYYPEGGVAGNLTGFVGFDGEHRVGRYGLEQYWEELLAGTEGYLSGVRAGRGGVIAAATKVFEPAVNGNDLVLTIVRPLQFTACRALDRMVAELKAKGGSVVVVDPNTGAVLALCSSPSFDPNRYGEAQTADAYDNDALAPYEPGSVMKPIIMASAIDSGVVTAQTAFDDPGQVEIGGFTIKNAAGKQWGRQTMVGVLERSINTGMVFVARRLGTEAMRRYVTDFGFGQPTGLTLPRDVGGDTSSLLKRGEIYAATASYGQGLTVNAVQLAMAYAAIANGGTLLKPYVVSEVVRPDGSRDTTGPTVVRRVLKPATAKTVGAMLASVIANGTTRLARIPGFWVAGKTGTAQLPAPQGGYYENLAIHTFAGFAPVEHPAVVTVAKFTEPQVAWAESSAAPLFAEVTSAALRLLRVPPDAQ